MDIKLGYDRLYQHRFKLIVHSMALFFLTSNFNSYVTELGNPLNARRRLKRQLPSDLKDQREEEE
jgi:hypothetical protein